MPSIPCQGVQQKGYLNNKTNYCQYQYLFIWFIWSSEHLVTIICCSYYSIMVAAFQLWGFTKSHHILVTEIKWSVTFVPQTEWDVSICSIFQMQNANTHSELHLNTIHNIFHSKFICFQKPISFLSLHIICFIL